MEGCPGGMIVITDHQPLVRLMDQPVLTRVQTRWLLLELFQLIRPTIKYQPRKANIVADALSRSQRSITEESIIIKAKVDTIEEQVFALSVATLEPTAEDVQVWRKAYIEDQS